MILLEIFKVLIPTIGGVIVFLTWRSGKMIDLVGRYFELYGEFNFQFLRLQIETTNRKNKWDTVRNELFQVKGNVGEQRYQALEKSINDQANQHNANLETQLEILETMNKNLVKRFQELQDKTFISLGLPLIEWVNHTSIPVG